VRAYLPEPKNRRRGIALCLSGGGFRAALFHLGALRRLNELGVLRHLTAITAVSGGSVVAAHLARPAALWRHQRMSTAAWDRIIATPFREFTSRNLSLWPVLKGWLQFWSNAGVEELAHRCDTRLLSSLRLEQLDGDWAFCAANLVTGQQYVLSPALTPEWPLANAVAASSCFPFFFRPYRKTEPHRIALSDGGVDDNLGLEPVWRSHEFLLVSDGGETLRSVWSRSLFWLLRAAFVTWNQGQDVRKRWLIENFLIGQIDGTYWGIDSAASHYAPPACGYSAALSRDVIAPIRTNYDAFSDAEAAVLENHGYFLADAAISTHLDWMRMNPVPPLVVPHPAWRSERKVREALRDSGKRGLVGRV